MKKIFILALILSLFVLLPPGRCLGQETVNKFGIHILEPADLPKAQELVNSSGGDWGWVTVVIREDDLNVDKWQGFMDECRERHLVPLVRIATHLDGENWVKPKIEDGQKWADFLGNLNWPVADQYVIVFNEPNHAKEWGGEVNPKEYAQILSELSEKLKGKSPLQGKEKFRILNAGLDLAAPNGKTTMEALNFMTQMNWEVPGIFDMMDGWASHSYPNHGFLGKPWDKGKTSIRGYEWELAVLKNYFSVKNEPPVFITETGWLNNNAKSANFFKDVFENVWLNDKRIMAVTPFVLNYPGGLFEAFSWLDKAGKPYPQFEAVKNIPKTNWWPEQEEKLEVVSVSLPPFLPAETTYNGKITLKNTGQSIIGERGEIVLLAQSPDEISVSNLSFAKENRIKPGERVTLNFSLSSLRQPGEYLFTWGNLPEYKIKVYPPSLITKTRYTLWELITVKARNLFR